ncbi:oxaloacetate decarboxylase subunit alpha [Geosporobacter ferrireducens]|uniref:Oxaloacetate decarboxylase n=1 Tax=Geosporobacter ferrireducens TaxID=1424294 RepID=A0A1D8GJA0_9FIRM|nr:oxaloacetate decarboxylase subunit alpha [Geosporobacter ferrireducens]AOT70986.1 oxaloacetate decarboxylase [Geosporobacter ferrireducens]MTI53703.1 oxaloacetate decarboxylase subunit alpha [Geosporobacter ferrireducens]
MAKIKISETVLRDAHQSLIATRMKTEEMAPILETLDQVGYHSLEVWGGATFDACLRFLNEDPWERLRRIRKHVKNTKLQMLLRGQNLLGYKHYSDDVVSEFVKKAIANGIDVLRIFDALNDVRNLETALNTTKKEGGHAQAAISYTISPAHNTENYLKVAKQMVDMGADSICVKDMSGILTPYYAFELITMLKKTVKVPIQLHTHYTSGIASMTYLKAIEAGVDVVDCAISPMALGTSQPPTEPLVATLQGTEYDTGLNLEVLNQIADHFRPIRDKYLETKQLDPKVLGVDVNALVYQVPGGMLSNLVSQLKIQNAVDKYEEVLKEVPRVREDLGFPPLVTPMSQMVGTQAVFNVVLGERYKMVPKEIKAYVRGEYGRPTVEIKEEIRRKIVGNEDIIVCRPADMIPPQLETIKNEMKEYFEQEEDVLSYALFPQVAVEYFKYRQAKKYQIDSSCVDKEQKTYPV